MDNLSNSNPFISVVIPYFNTPKTLEITLEALYVDEYPNKEILIIDDGSNVSIDEIKYADKVRYFKLTENKGQAYARNYGVKHAKGNFIVFLDSDVTIKKNLIKRFSELIKQKYDIIATSYDIENSLNAFQNYQNTFNFYTAKCKKGGFFWTHCGCIRKDLFIKIGGFNENLKKSFGDDFEFSSRLFKYNKSFNFFLINGAATHNKDLNFKKFINHYFKHAFYEFGLILPAVTRQQYRLFLNKIFYLPFILLACFYFSLPLVFLNFNLILVSFIFLLFYFTSRVSLINLFNANKRIIYFLLAYLIDSIILSCFSFAIIGILRRKIWKEDL